MILDSNILAKIVLEEPDSKQAVAAVKSFVRKGSALYTVDLALTEAMNVIWKHAKLLKELDDKKVASALEDLVRLFDGLNVISTRDLTAESMQIALTRNLTIYDTLYLAAAQKMNGTLFTTDQKLCSKAGETPTALLKPER